MSLKTHMNPLMKKNPENKAVALLHEGFTSCMRYSLQEFCLPSFSEAEEDTEFGIVVMQLSRSISLRVILALVYNKRGKGETSVGVVWGEEEIRLLVSLMISARFIYFSSLQPTTAFLV